MMTGRLAVAWGVSVIIFLTWDLLWCSSTTFRAMSFLPTYLFMLIGATAVTLPLALAPRHPWLQLTVWLAVAAVMVANLMYYRTYYSAIPATAYLMAGNLSDFRGSVTDSLALTDLLLPAEGIAGYYLLRRLKPERRHITAWVDSMMLLGLAAWLSALPYGGPLEHIRFLSRQCYYGNTPAAIYTPAGPLVAELLDAAEPLSSEQKALVEEWLAEHGDRQSRSPYMETPSPKSLVIIFLESMESWPIGLTVEGQEVTPLLNSLVADTISVTYASNLVTQVGAGRSIDAQLLMLNGLLPMASDVAAMNYSSNRYYSIAEAMKEDGADRCYLLTGDKASVWNQARFAASTGIDTLIDSHCWEMTEKIGNPAKLADGALFAQTVEKMERGEIFPIGERAYLHIVAYSGHNPWRIPDDRKGLTLKGQYPDKYADYLTAMNYVDRSLSPLVEYLRGRPDADDIVIAIAGDHEGLAAYRDAMLSHQATKDIVGPLGHTPLIIVNSPRPGRFDFEAGQVDVYSTLLDAMGLCIYPWRGMGESFFSPAHPHEAAGRDGLGTSDPHLLQAPRVSDLIIRYDLLRDSVEH
ncbi:MAG: LTA synthase family protein [Pseudoflavonifractor sp.]|nr:LTA synthase family protein [Pseudoflavonifractor sp.]